MPTAWLVRLGVLALLSARLCAQDVSQQVYLKASNAELFDQFGRVVAISGDTVAVTALDEDSAAAGVNGAQADNSALDAGAVYIFVRSGTNWSQQAYLKASNTDAFDHFGSSLALVGDTLVVGAASEASAATGVGGDQDDDSAAFAGAVFVFERAGGSWSQTAYLKASNADASDSFGAAVALSPSGATLVVTAPGERSAASGVNGDESDDTLVNAGAAYVFVRSGASWAQQAYLKSSSPDANDRFGNSVSLWGDTLAVGVAAEDSVATGVNGDDTDDSEQNSGAVFVFERSASTWTQQAYLKASNTDFFDGFGGAVALSGDSLVVGASGEGSSSTGVNGDQHNSGANVSGAVYSFVRSGAVWTQDAYIKASNTGFADNFGAQVALSSEILAVSAPGEDSDATGVNGEQNTEAAENAGAVYVFVRDGGSWTQLAYLKGSDTTVSMDSIGDRFGAALALDHETLVAGAWGEESGALGLDGDPTDNGATESGAAYAFDLDLDPWSDQGFGLFGAAGVPGLSGAGPLSAGSANSVTLSMAAPSAFTGLFVGLSATPTPFKGGMITPVPWLKLFFTATSSSGGLSLPFVMPAGVPALTELWLQAAVQDPAAPVGVALSNALRGVVP